MWYKQPAFKIEIRNFVAKILSMWQQICLNLSNALFRLTQATSHLDSQVITGLPILSFSHSVHPFRCSSKPHLMSKFGVDQTGLDLIYIFLPTSYWLPTRSRLPSQNLGWTLTLPKSAHRKTLLTGNTFCICCASRTDFMNRVLGKGPTCFFTVTIRSPLKQKQENDRSELVIN